MNNEEEIKQLKEEIISLKTELEKTKEHLKRYTAPVCKKQYYENNKEVIKEKIKEYKKDYKYSPSKEQKQRWARSAYLNRKAKLEKEKLYN